jgi:hypothetical protein
MTDGSPDFKAAAEAKFGALTSAFASDTSYWQLGHVFDTALDYFAVVSAGAAADFGATAKEQFDAVTGSGQWDGYWYDDHGWWGIAALRASQRPGWFGPLSGDFQQISERCWTTMDTMAPTVYKRRPKPGGLDRFAPLEPRFDGGVWNSEWSTTGAQPCDPTIELTDAKPLCGYQNSVTNLLYLILASRRYTAYENPQDEAAADREYGFLSHWFAVTPASDALLDRYQPNRLNVRAEVSAYKSGERVSEYDSAFVWVGDQGLLLGALVERMSRAGTGGSGYADLFATAEQLLAGTYDRFTTNQALTKHWISPSTAANTDPDDYKTGPAVFFRYLLHAYQANDDLKALVGGKNSVYRALVQASAQRAAEQKSRNQGMVALANDLAALVAAVAILAPETQS